MQLLRSQSLSFLSNTFHPFLGNKYTLETRPNQEGIDVRQELLKFHSTYYSSNLMAICVLGRGKNSSKFSDNRWSGFCFLFIMTFYKVLEGYEV